MSLTVRCHIVLNKKLRLTSECYIAGYPFFRLSIGPGQVSLRELEGTPCSLELASFNYFKEDAYFC